MSLLPFRHNEFTHSHAHVKAKEKLFSVETMCLYVKGLYVLKLQSNTFEAYTITRETDMFSDVNVMPG